MIRSMERSTIINGEWYKSMSAGGVGEVGAYELIATEILTVNTPSVTFSSLATHASTYKHLQIRFVAKNTGSSTQINTTFNGVSTANHANHRMFGSSASVTSAANFNQTGVFLIESMTQSTPANSFCGGFIDLLDSFSNTKNTTLRALYGQANFSVAPTRIYLQSGLFNNTDSLTSISFAPAANSFAIGTRFSLYGIKG